MFVLGAACTTGRRFVAFLNDVGIQNRQAEHRRNDNAKGAGQGLAITQAFLARAPQVLLMRIHTSATRTHDNVSVVHYVAKRVRRSNESAA